MDLTSPSKSFQPTECQYYVLSPRTSIESPKRRSRKSEGGADENADHNSQRGGQAGKGGALKSKTPSKTPSKRPTASSPMSARSPARQHPGEQRPPSARRSSEVMACMRPATPTRTRKAGPAAEASSPSQSATGHTLLMSPERVAGMSDYEDMTSFASTSVYSEMSVSSRLDQLSRKQSSKKHLSSQEMEKLKIEEKKRELMNLRKRNEMNSRKARMPAAPKHTKSTKVTVPKEFSLSAPPTPRARSRNRDASSDHEDSVGTMSVGSGVFRTLKENVPRSARTPRSTPTSPGPRKETPTKSKPWRPQLTVPRGPRCSLPGSQRGSRRSVSAPPEDCGASDSENSAFGDGLSTCSRNSAKLSPEELAERRRQACAEAAKAQRNSVKASASKTSIPEQKPTGLEGQKPTEQKKASKSGKPSAAADAEARAQRAKETAMRKKEEEAAKEKERLVFKRPAGARGSQQPVSEVQQHSQTAAPASTASRRAASGDRKAPRTTPRKRDGNDTPRETERPTSARERRPSFGSSANRPCCA